MSTPSLICSRNRTFARRACLYSSLDETLFHRTRFFGAAAATNRLLNHFLASVVGRLMVSQHTCLFLNEIGSRLEIINLRNARKIAAGSFAAGQIDAIMVIAEQCEVQKSLETAYLASRARYVRITRQLDQILDPDGFRARIGHRSGLATRYVEVLHSVCDELGRPICFAEQRDREAIGLALIVTLHSHDVASV